jgi:hypothetical protein
MTGFRADTTELADLATAIELSEPFSALSAAALRVAVPASATATAVAIERLKHRLVAELDGLAAATGSLGRATRSAAEGYQGVEASISRRAGG